MWILADILIIAIVAFFVYSSVKRGFVKSIMGSAARIVSIVLVFNLCTPFGAYLGESAIGDAVKVKIEEKIEKAFEKSEADDSDTIIENLEVPGFMSVWMTEQSENAKWVADNAKEGTKNLLFEIAMKIIAALLLYIIIRIIFQIVIFILGMLVKLPVLGGIDKSLGIIAGVINSLIVIAILTMAIMFFAPADATVGIQSTYIFKYVYYIMLQFLA